MKQSITEQIQDLIETYGNNITCRIDLVTNNVEATFNSKQEIEKPLFIASDYLNGIECILKPIAECNYLKEYNTKIFLYLQNDHFGCIASNGTIFGSIFEETATGAIDEFKRLYAQPGKFNFSITIL